MLLKINTSIFTQHDVYRYSLDKPVYKGCDLTSIFQNNTSRIITCILKDRVIPIINELYDDEEFYFQPSRESPNYTTNVRRLHNEPSLENGLDAKVRFTGLLNSVV